MSEYRRILVAVDLFPDSVINAPGQKAASSQRRVRPLERSSQRLKHLRIGLFFVLALLLVLLLNLAASI